MVDHTPNFGTKLVDVSTALKRCGPSLVQGGSDNDRVKRGLERLRRAATAVLEPPSSMKTEYPSDVIVCSKTILEQITDVLCDAIIHVSASRTCE